MREADEGGCVEVLGGYGVGWLVVLEEECVCIGGQRERSVGYPAVERESGNTQLYGNCRYGQLVLVLFFSSFVLLPVCKYMYIHTCLLFRDCIHLLIHGSTLALVNGHMFFGQLVISCNHNRPDIRVHRGDPRVHCVGCLRARSPCRYRLSAATTGIMNAREKA